MLGASTCCARAEALGVVRALTKRGAIKIAIESSGVAPEHRKRLSAQRILRVMPWRRSVTFENMA